MGEISIELVPRDIMSLESDLKFLKENFGSVSMINIPDLTRLQMGSIESSSIAQKYYARTIPHIRACDFTKNTYSNLVKDLKENDLDEILIVSGDDNVLNYNGGLPSISLIKLFRENNPEIKILAAIDPYRYKKEIEVDYIYEKFFTGANGFFTQPFFDLKLLQDYIGISKKFDVFYGLSPVLSERSQNYWETQNKVVFPKGFKPTLDWNIGFAKEFIGEIKRGNKNIYIMPIRADLEKYLGNILE